jgi:hypothetical protein
MKREQLGRPEDLNRTVSQILSVGGGSYYV